MIKPDETHQYGNTTVEIYFDRAAKTPEQLEQVHQKIIDACWPIIDEMIARGETV